ncbi:TPR repeat-containing protein [Halothece sp. PCC 7418]|uniref:hypothetical protein n=1 Tax=Halothece sp. (strain PCC 7418) TaxID=65093 RepID=UPI0002A0834F|nr:hypothetical protein [Halothece sp. PCC 7418]AFZ43498.1 TPR repeat-containing protein [Halothece sp. PCC 7418]
MDRCLAPVNRNGINFDPEYQNKWHSYQKITGDVSRSSQSNPQIRLNLKNNNNLSSELLEYLSNNSDYQQIIEITGYFDPS